MRISLAVLVLLAAPSLRALSLEEGEKSAAVVVGSAREMRHRRSLAGFVLEHIGDRGPSGYGLREHDGDMQCVGGAVQAVDWQMIYLIRTPDCSRIAAIEARRHSTYATIAETRENVTRTRSYRADPRTGDVFETRDATEIKTYRGLEGAAAEAEFASRRDGIFKAFGAAALQDLRAKGRTWHQDKVVVALEEPGVTVYVENSGPNYIWKVDWTRRTSRVEQVGSALVPVHVTEHDVFDFDPDGTLREFKGWRTTTRVASSVPVRADQQEFESIVDGRRRHWKQIEAWLSYNSD